MAATIIEQGKVCDGFDVRVLRNGVYRTIHFADAPPDVQAAVNSWDAEVAAQEQAAIDADDWAIVEA